MLTCLCVPNSTSPCWTWWVSGCRWTGKDASGSLAPLRPDVTSYVPIIHGCDLMCTFCIIPYRRGRQVSRPVDEVVREVGLAGPAGR